MSESTWICTNNPWHDFAGGLTCRWCDATRTAGEAIVSGLASSRGGTEDAAKALLDAHHTEVRREGARLLEDAACDADWGKTPDFCAGLRAGAELLLAAGEKATAEAATATPDFFQPGHTYAEVGDTTDWKFRCDYVTAHPEDGERTALGWRHFRGEWEPYAYGEDDWEIHRIADHIDAAEAGDS
jgi:hypothetical protein